MTKLITTNPPSPLGALRSYGQLPAMFNEHWLEEALSAFNKWEKAFENPNAHYPYDISYLKDENNNPTEYRLDIALAGVGKESIKLSIKDQHLIIEVNKTHNRDEDPNVNWLRTGISYRNTKLQFSLGKDVDIRKITSSYKDGLLCIVVPVLKTKVTDIEIKVD